MEEFHCQCELMRQRARRVSWIPEKYAKEGRVIMLKDKKGNWEDGWIVKRVYGRRRSSEAIKRENDHKKNRRHSDI